MNLHTEGLLPFLVTLFPELTKSEAESLYLLSIGMQNKDVGEIKCRTEHTIKKNIIAMFEKFNVNKQSELRIIYHCRLMTYMTFNIK
ncbi:hypothetical protein AT251_12895 [Enterovibrio nigricans]|uniref:Regulatory protein, luxR family n=1 Tax=Enterovibrio nigricans DSM 22720 TaxID=1121868 RepID=A0A1T4V9N0_9GAMM|nr:hypothetical protein AT251_12895 [Enterovibrio nigricans]SKA61231.1 regulatory protein, luxR family [Enterovibrio nigricans DSM 22720]